MEQHVMTQYTLDNDDSPEKKQTMQKVNLVLSDGRGLYHNASGTGVLCIGWE